MNGEVARIIRYTEKSKLGEELTEAILIAGAGIEGDRRSGVSVFSEQARLWVDTQQTKGLCFARFKENITLRDADVSELKAKGRFAIGETILRVNPGAKRCYSECKLNGEHCAIATDAFIAEIERGGKIYIGGAINEG